MFDHFHFSAAPKKVMASLLALMVSLGPIVSPAYAAPSSTATPIQRLVVIFQETFLSIITSELTPTLPIPRESQNSRRHPTPRRSMVLATRCSISIPT